MKKKQFVLHNNKNVKMFNCKKNIRGRDNLRFEFGRKKVKTIELYFLLSVRVIRRAFFYCGFRFGVRKTPSVRQPPH